MKSFLVLLLLSSSFISNAQKNEPMFLGEVMPDTTVKTQVNYLGSKTVQDSGGIYTTTFHFAPKMKKDTFNINVYILLDEPFIPWYETDSTKNAPDRYKHTVDVQDDFGKSKLRPEWGYNFKGIVLKGLVESHNIYVSVKSKTKLTAIISGISRDAL